MSIPRPSNVISLVAVLAVIVLAAGGCAEQKTEGEVVTYTTQTSAVVGAALGCIAGAAIGYALRGWSGRLGWGLLILCPLLLVFMVPGLAMDYVRVDPDGFACRYGFWFAPSQHTVKFDDVREMRLVETERRGRRGRKTIDIDLVCTRKDGGSQTVDVGDLMKKAVPEILERANARGVAIVAE